MDDTDCDIVIKISYSFTLLGTTTNATEYYGYNTKTKTVKEFKYYTAEDFTKAKSQVNNGNYKGRTGKVG